MGLASGHEAAAPEMRPFVGSAACVGCRYALAGLPLRKTTRRLDLMKMLLQRYIFG
jgi:hypothetical protein